MTASQQTVNPVPPHLQGEYMSREEAASELRIHIDTVGKKIRAGVLTAIKYHGRTFVSRESAKKYLDAFRHVAN